MIISETCPNRPHIIKQFAEAGSSGASGADNPSEESLLERFPEASEELLLQLLKLSSRAIIKYSYKWIDLYSKDECLSIGTEIAIKAYWNWEKAGRQHKWTSHLIYDLRRSLRSKSKQYNKYKTISDYQKIDHYDSVLLLEDKDSTISSDYFTKTFIPEVHDTYCNTKDVLIDLIKDILTEEEFYFIYNIHFNYDSISKAGAEVMKFNNRMSSLNYYNKLLKRIKINLKDKMSLEDIL